MAQITKGEKKIPENHSGFSLTSHGYITKVNTLELQRSLRVRIVISQYVNCYTAQN